MASIVRPMQTKQRNCTNSQSIIYLTDLTNIYQEQDCITTKSLWKRRIPASLKLTRWDGTKVRKAGEDKIVNMCIKMLNSSW